MHLNRGLLGWGVFFIVLGSVPLAVRAGMLDPDVVRRAWELWPLLLVGLGLGLILERTRVAMVGGLVVAVTFGLLGGALLAGGFELTDGIGACDARTERSEPFPEQRGAFSDGAVVDLDLSCGELLVEAADRDGWALQGRSPDGTPPPVTASQTSLRVRSPETRGLVLGDRGSRWELELPFGAGLDRLRISINAGSAEIRTGSLPVDALSVSVNAGSATVDLGQDASLASVTGSANAGSLSLTLPAPEGSLDGSLSVNAGSADVCLPAGTPLRVRTGDTPLGSHNLEDRGLVHSGNTWSTPGFEDAPGSVDLTVSINLGSLTLNPENGCD